MSHSWDRGLLENEYRPLPQYLALHTAKAKARRAFWRGLLIGAVAGCIAGAAFAGDTASWMGTGCRLVPVTGQAHVAEITCTNVNTSGASFTEGAMVAWDMVAHVAIIHGPGDIADRFTITPPEGLMAVPPVILLDENTSGVVLLMPWSGA